MAFCKTCCQSLLSISMCWDWFCIASFAILWMSTAWLSYSKVLIEISSSFQDFTNFIIFLHFQRTCTVIVYVSDKGQTSVVVYTVTHRLKTLLNSTSWTLIIMTIYDIPHAHGCTCNCMNCLFIKIESLIFVCLYSRIPLWMQNSIFDTSILPHISCYLNLAGVETQKVRNFPPRWSKIYWLFHVKFRRVI